MCPDKAKYDTKPSFHFCLHTPFLEMRLIASSQAKILCSNPGRLMSIPCMVVTSMMMPRPRPPPPRSCDTFVVVAADGSPVPTVFGKNSDRPCTGEEEIEEAQSAGMEMWEPQVRGFGLKPEMIGVEVHASHRFDCAVTCMNVSESRGKRPCCWGRNRSEISPPLLLHCLQRSTR
jgi:hypothetical protein